MKFTDFEPYLHQILALEFRARDHEIQVNSTRLRQEMNARGMLNSTETLNNLADFLAVEFKTRCGLAAEFIVGKLAVLEPIDGRDMTSHCVPMFRTIAVEQSAHIQNIYDEIAGPIALPLQSRMPAELRQNLSKQMDD